MKNIIFFTSILLITSIIVSTIALAATTGDITATVTAQNVAVTVSDGTVAYGTIAVNQTEDTTSAGIDDTQTVTNTGNVTGDISVQGTDSTDWELGDTIGSEQYSHKSCTTTCDTTPTWTVFNEDAYTTLNNNVAANGTVELDLQLLTPSATTHFDQQSVNVTVMIAAS